MARESKLKDKHCSGLAGHPLWYRGPCGYHVIYGWCANWLHVPVCDGTFCSLPGQGDRNGEVDGMLAEYSLVQATNNVYLKLLKSK